MHIQEIILSNEFYVNADDILALEHKRTADEAGFDDALMLERGQPAQTRVVSRTATTAGSDAGKRSERKSVKRNLVRPQGERIPDVAKILNAPNLKMFSAPVGQLEQRKEGASKEELTAASDKKARFNAVGVEQYTVQSLPKVGNERAEVHRKFPDLIPNFYTKANVSPCIVGIDHEIERVLLDGEDMVNLIPEWVARKLNMTVVPIRSLSVRGHNGRTSSLPGYVRTQIKIARVARDILAYVLPELGTS
ncbi:hypothetical protein LTR93_011992 [Exophiala xenobiotica]|nr:hypothetical protein LTR93_011992 [Exophiala xenobiotica]